MGDTVADNHAHGGSSLPADSAAPAALSGDIVRTAPAHFLRACPDCGRMHFLPTLDEGHAARCERCDGLLRRSRRDPVDRSLALALCALILFTLATFTPFLTMSISGQNVSADLVTGSLQLDQQGFWELAALVAATTLVAPVARLLATSYVLLALRLRRPPRHLAPIFRWAARLKPWSMIEVFLLAVLVAYAKLIDMASIEIGIAVFAFAGVMLATVAADLVLDPEVVWEAIDRRDRGTKADTPLGTLSGAVGCECCGLVSRPQPFEASCPRCGAPLHARKPNSLTRTWALVIAATILYIPANLYPVMTVISMGRGAPDTILSGVVELVQADMLPLALLVFFASITVPVLKLVGLTILLVTTQRRSRARLRDRTVLYRIVEAIGRWSMIDVFMLSILVGLVRLGNLATIEPGLGAISFASVVILTMIAAESFDPRLMWDAAGMNGPQATAAPPPEKPSPS